MITTIKKGLDFCLERLTESHKIKIPEVYIPVFSGHPWHEEFECSCGYQATYSYGCSTNGDKKRKCEQFDGKHLIMLTREVLESRCRNPECGKSVGSCIKPVFTDISVSESYSADYLKQGFDGFCAKVSSKLAGFAWGYNFPLNHKSQEGSVWYDKAGIELQNHGIPPEISFYHNESGTLPKYQRKGIGTSLLGNMLKNTPEDRRFVVFRTINPGMIRCYEKVFGMEPGNLKPLFRDPNPAKRQFWYALDLKNVRLEKIYDGR